MINSPSDTLEPPALVEFEGMRLPQAQIDEIKARREAAQQIKDGIDVEHINSWDDFIRTFKIALGRAEARRILASQPVDHHD